MHAKFAKESSQSYTQGIETYQGQKQEEEQAIIEKREQIKHLVADRLCAEIDIAVIKAMHEGKTIAYYEYTEFFSPIQYGDHSHIDDLIQTVMNALKTYYSNQGYSYVLSDTLDG